MFNVGRKAVDWLKMEQLEPIIRLLVTAENTRDRDPSLKNDIRSKIFANPPSWSQLTAQNLDVKQSIETSIIPKISNKTEIPFFCVKMFLIFILARYIGQTHIAAFVFKVVDEIVENAENATDPAEFIASFIEKQEKFPPIEKQVFDAAAKIKEFPSVDVIKIVETVLDLNEKNLQSKINTFFIPGDQNKNSSKSAKTAGTATVKRLFMENVVNPLLAAQPPRMTVLLTLLAALLKNWKGNEEKDLNEIRNIAIELLNDNNFFSDDIQSSQTISNLISEMFPKKSFFRKKFIKLISS